MTTPQDGIKNEFGWDEALELVGEADLRSVRRLLDDIIAANRALGIELTAPTLSRIVEHMYSCDMCFTVYTKGYRNAR